MLNILILNSNSISVIKANCKVNNEFGDNQAY